MVGMTAKIEMKSWPAGGSSIAAMSMAMIVAHGAAVMADDAIAKDGLTVAIAANDDAFAIHRSAAGSAVVREAAAGVVAVKGLRTGRSENSQTGGNSNEGEEFFHDERRFAFDLLPHSNGVFMRRGPAARIRDSSNFFIAKANHGGRTDMPRFRLIERVFAQHPKECIRRFDESEHSHSNGSRNERMATTTNESVRSRRSLTLKKVRWNLYGCVIQYMPRAGQLRLSGRMCSAMMRSSSRTPKGLFR